MRFAKRAGGIAPFEVMEVLSRAHALEAQGRRVIHLEIGEPDFTATASVVAAGERALRDGCTAYTAALGLPQLREALAEHYAAHLGARVPASRIAVTAGASGGLLLLLASLVDAGDEVLVPDPGYPGYRQFVRAFEGRPRALPVDVRNAFQPTLSGVRDAWSARTVGMVLGTPSNPTGTLISREALRRIAGFVGERGGFLIVDEIYQGLVYDGQAPWTAAELDPCVIVVNSFSKYFCMTGWRLGWAVLPDALVRPFERIAQHLFICPSAIAQHAALAAFLPETLAILEQRRVEFEARRNFLLPALEGLGLPVPARPSGAFYLYADCSRYDADARRFSLDLLERAGVAATPGLDFGENATASHLRFAYTRGLDDLREATERLGGFLGRA
ncbi:MAG: pyridoxal phosphate-dependent aminotransferase [Burkholderiales bacterium]